MQDEARSNTIRMSVIIPVYNKQESLAACLESLAAQTAPKDSFEAIFVDDGSTDDSLAMLNAAQALYPFAKVFAQDNQGVSSARNAGIKRAIGDYIMFLDADDYITPETIQALITAFDKSGDMTDVFAYRMLYRYNYEREDHYHRREDWLWRNGVYQLEDGPYVAQTTINVCVRNRFQDNILFSTDMKMGEDQLYVTQNLERKATYGYTYKAEYVYVRDKGSASSRRNNPLYAYDDMLALFNELLAIGERNVLMRRYVHCLILYNVDWRLKCNMLYPNHLKGEERVAAEKRLADVLGAIPHATYEENPYLTPYHKAFLLEKYVHVDQKVQVIHTNDSSLAVFKDDSIWHAFRPTITIERATCRDLKLSIRGRIACSTFAFEDQPELTLIVGRNRRSIPLAFSSFSYAEARIPVTKAWSFAFQEDLSNKTGRVRIKFELTMNGHIIPKSDLALCPLVHNARVLNDEVYCYPQLTLEVERKTLVASIRKSAYPKKRYLKDDLVNRQVPKLRHHIGKLMKSLSGKRCWMYVDLPTSMTEGSSLVQLLHDLQYDDGIERFYISDYSEALELKYPILKGKVFSNASDMHKALSLKSEIIICSYLERFTFEPFGEEEFGYVGDLASNQVRVYVQHGVLHAHSPWYFSYDRLMIDKEVVSTTLELDSLRSIYGFSENAIIQTGAPRLDNLMYCGEDKKKKVLYIPSWRSYLVMGSAQERVPIDGGLESSSFYKGFAGLVRSLEESNLLEEAGYVLEVKLHPNFKCYEHLFQFESNRISLASDVIDEGEYAVVITDFSSYVYDFIYTGARVLYFFPDRIEFDAGLNHYSELDIDLRNGFGPYAETPEDALEKLRELLNDSNPSNDSYIKRGNKLFLHTDGKNCQRLYSCLCELTDFLQ